MNKTTKTPKAAIIPAFAALFAALIAVSGFISIPLPGSPVPIVLQNMMPVLTGALAGGVYAGLATGFFLLAGGAGLPVFAGGGGGMASLLGPTGGFLAGYFVAALVTGFLLRCPRPAEKTPLFKIAVSSLAGFAVIYVLGIARFMQVMDRPLRESLLLACFPYLPGDAVKCVLVSFLAVKLRPVSAKYLSADV